MLSVGRNLKRNGHKKIESIKDLQPDTLNANKGTPRSKSKAGRPTKYVPEIIEKILNAIAVGAPFTHACNYAGISFETFNEWRKQYSEFSEQVKEAEGKAVIGWLARIEQAAKDGNWTAAAWKLERRFPEDFGKRDKIQVDVKQLDTDIERELAIIAAGRQTDSSGEAESETIN